jgi:hypothetical protein
MAYDAKTVAGRRGLCLLFSYQRALLAGDRWAPAQARDTNPSPHVDGLPSAKHDEQGLGTLGCVTSGGVGTSPTFANVRQMWATSRFRDVGSIDARLNECKCNRVGSNGNSGRRTC